MALFGKKKKVEPTDSPATAPIAGQNEMQMTDDDALNFDAPADESGQSIDFDAIAADREREGAAPMGAPAAATAPDDFGTTSDFGASNADDDLDFNAVFNDGSPVADSDISSDNPFGNDPIDATTAPVGEIAIEPNYDAPPLTYAAPLLTSDAVATAGGPAVRKAFPLPLFLGALGLLVALGAVGYLATKGDSTPDDAVAITETTSPLKKQIGLVDGANVVDGVPIAPGAVASALAGPRPTVPLTPQLLKQLKDLWKQGAAAKGRQDFAGARTAWQKMLALRPNHPGVQSAIDQLPPAA